MKQLVVFFVCLVVSGCSSSYLSDPTDRATVSSKERNQDSVQLSATPLVIIEPLYPRAALRDRVEGYVRFQFDVRADGFADNIRVVESSPKGVFEAQATQALKKWRFQPKLADGKEAAQKDQHYTLEFRLE